MKLNPIDPNESRPVYSDYVPIKGKIYQDPLVIEMVNKGYKARYDARAGILTVCKEDADNLSKEKPL